MGQKLSIEIFSARGKQDEQLHRLTLEALTGACRILTCARSRTEFSSLTLVVVKTHSFPIARERTITADLSQREREVLTHLVNGLSNVEIAERLFLSEGTVRNYSSSIRSSSE